MEIPFLTLEKYNGTVIPPSGTGRLSKGSESSLQWLPATDAPSWIRDAVAMFFAERGDALREIHRLDYADSNGLGNEMYMLAGDVDRLFLKILGDKMEGNERETQVWKILGYDEASKQAEEPFEPIMGLPPRKFVTVDEDVNSILTPFYPCVLKAVSGGSYELPLVLCAVLCLERTLRGLHGRGLAYMDLCPANILFKETPAGFLLFYLTDMGGVKPLSSCPQDQPDFAKLIENMVSRRWTRREVLPPLGLFEPHGEDDRFEDSPAYDFHTLARTAMILLGMGSRPEPDAQVLASFREELSLEEPLEAKASEINRFLTLVEPWLKGQTLNEEAANQVRADLETLFRQFFETRVNFVVNRLGSGVLGQETGELLRNRMVRYKMALGKQYPAFEQDLQKRLAQDGGGDLSQQFQRLLDLPEAMVQNQMERACQLLGELAQSDLVRLSRTANYSFFFHKKVMRSLLPAGSPQRAGLAGLGEGLPQFQVLSEPGETETLRVLRRTLEPPPLGILKRSF